jgi:hypothetical protein
MKLLAKQGFSGSSLSPKNQAYVLPGGLGLFMQGALPFNLAPII